MSIPEITKAAVNDVISHINRYQDIEVYFNQNDFLVIADISQGISEFETRLVASLMGEDRNGEDANIVIFLNNHIDLIDNRVDYRERANGQWQARYTLAAL